jgi:uncharacterized MAPEG superfamily protein
MLNRRRTPNHGQQQESIMTTAYWCVFVVFVFPYILVLSARLPGLTLEKNLIPRIASDSFTGVRQRVYWAHLNGLEVAGPFAATVIIAQQLHGNQTTIDALALAFVVFRLGHALAYIANRGVLRTVMFMGGMVTMVTMFITAAG